ncbi:hypothetical protein PMAYCL1PPCAC_23649 [Pristionchus mayeri]|uniref:RNA binding protein n=1 Tax=Pristionchus mayeri TaxID=1317129 RepID=A0AAN5D0Q6_9BILA|nr:hypothetical protein PMAYCL1PPCAC_23649 [Pristionchus mayeri]
MSQTGRLLSDFKVAELKVELEKRGLPTQGIKVGLVERMSKWMIENGLNPATHLFEGSDSTPCSPSKTATIPPVVSTSDAALSSPSVEAEKDSKTTSASKTTTKEDKKEGQEEEEKGKEEDKTEDDTKKEDEKQEDGNLVAKEKEMAARSIWIKNLKSGTKALEIKAMCTPMGHVVRAKMFTVKGKESSSGMTGLGYVTFATVNEADLAVLRLDKSQLKGVTVDVNKASPHNLPFLKAKKKETPIASTANGGNAVEKKEEEKKKEEKKTEEKGKESKKEETAPTAPVVVKEEPKREELQRPSVPPRFPVRTAPTPSNGKRGSNDGRSGEKKEEKEKEKELARKLAEKEREHKKREEELKLQKEKERIRYEKEKVEKEKLRLQLEKLKAEIARGSGSRGEKREERSGRDEREKEKERNREREREKEKEKERDRDRKRERASYIAPATPQRVSRESYSSRVPERTRDERERKREAYHPSRNQPINYTNSAKRRRVSPNRRDNRTSDIRTLSSSAFLPSTQGTSRPNYSSHLGGGSGWTGGHNYNSAALNPWASTVSQYPPQYHQRRY